MNAEICGIAAGAVASALVLVAAYELAIGPETSWPARVSYAGTALIALGGLTTSLALLLRAVP